VADTETTEPEVDETEETEEDSGSGISLDGLNSKVDNLIGKVEALLKGGPARSRASKADDAADVAAQVRSEVSKLNAAEKKEAARRGELESLKQTVQKLAEKAPVEYRRITTMLWGDPDD
jgi:hypothetical protein